MAGLNDPGGPRGRAQLADYARRLHARGWVANHDGNVTVRLAEGRTLATPTAVSKADVTPDSLVLVDDGGRVVQGGGRVFSEIMLHLTVYRSRPDVGAVVHAHPPTATGFAIAGAAVARLLDQSLLPEAVVSLGPGVPLVPFAPPGEAACRALASFTLTHDAVLVENHGVFAWGRDLGQAYLGNQGDIWDAQKDSALAAIGVAIAVFACRWPRLPRANGLRP